VLHGFVLAAIDRLALLSNKVFDFFTGINSSFALQGLEKLDQFGLFRCAQIQREMRVVMFNNGMKVRETPIVIKATLAASKQPAERRRSIALVR